ncbi:MAG TPA: ABC transporter permease [Vicinamibacterales bacterium]
MSEIRYALRTVIKAPGPALVMVLTLGVAIGAATVIYSVVDLVRHLVPAVDQHGLVYVASTETRIVQTGQGTRNSVLRSPVSVPDLADWRSRSSSFEQLTGFRMASTSLTGIEIPLRLTAINVTANLPDVWGFAPSLGRNFRVDEGLAGSSGVVMLSHRFWEQHFSANVNVIGQTMLLDEVPHTVIGVLPRAAGTGFFREADVFTPLVVDALRGSRDRREVLVVGRLRQGVTREQAHADLQAIAVQLGREHPDTNQTVSADVLPLVEASGFNVRILLAILGLIGMLIIVVACANLASVMVAQSLARRHELAIHAALGASRGHRIRRLLVEGFLVACAASLVGLLVAAWGMAGLRWLGSTALGFADLQMNGRVLAASLLIACATPIGFGLLPALRMAPPDPQELRDGARAAGATRRGRRLRNLIVALQTGAAMVLMVQIGLFIRTTWKLSDVAPGFEPAQVLTFHIGLPSSRYAQPDAIDRFVGNMLQRLGSLPGVSAAGVIDRLPIADGEQMSRLTTDRTVSDPPEKRPLVARSAIAGDFLTTLRIPLRRGRTITEAELTKGAPVVVINEEMARRFWPGRDPIGSRLALDAGLPRGSSAEATQEMWLEVVGIVGNLRNSDVDQGPLPQVFVSLARHRSRDFAVALKSTVGDPLQLVTAIRGQVAAIDPNQPIYDVASMRQVLFTDMASTYVLSAILSTIGFIALVLSAAGIYGLVAYSVTQRRREIGVRMALGGTPGAIVRMLIAHASRPVVVGSLVGFVIAAGLSLLLAAGMPEIDPRDPMSYGGVISLILVSALLATLLPARRAATIDPVQALRAD